VTKGVKKMERKMTVKDWKKLLNKFPDNALVFVDSRAEYLDSDVSAELKEVKFYPEENSYGLDNKEFEGQTTKAVVIEI
jgi:hypothetical protein